MGLSNTEILLIKKIPKKHQKKKIQNPTCHSLELMCLFHWKTFAMLDMVHMLHDKTQNIILVTVNHPSFLLGFFFLLSEMGRLLYIF